MTERIPPGWYVITHQSQAPTCWYRRSDGCWSPHRHHAFPTNDLPQGWTLGPQVDDLLRAVNGPHGIGWETINTAPQDGSPVWVYTAMEYGLPPFEGPCAYHADAGWCTDELRPVTHWHPETTKILHDAAEAKDLQQTFDRVWKAQMRGVERWQSAAPGRDLTFPDQGDLIVWLLDQLKEHERDAGRLNWLIEHQRIGLRGESPKEIRQAIDAEIAREKQP